VLLGCVWVKMNECFGRSQKTTCQSFTERKMTKAMRMHEKEEHPCAGDVSLILDCAKKQTTFPLKIYSGSYYDLIPIKDLFDYQECQLPNRRLSVRSGSEQQHSTVEGTLESSLHQ
jgi:hypothetical protein